jgi:hypothetical protein
MKVTTLCKSLVKFINLSVSTDGSYVPGYSVYKFSAFFPFKFPVFNGKCRVLIFNLCERQHFLIYYLSITIKL